MNSPIDQYLDSLKVELTALIQPKVSRFVFGSNNPLVTPQSTAFINQALDEVSNHLIESADQLVSRGTERTAAENQAVLNLGSAKQLAAALNEKGKPLLSYNVHLIAESVLLAVALLFWVINSKTLPADASFWRWLAPVSVISGPTMVFGGFMIVFSCLPLAYVKYKLKPRYMALGGLLRNVIAVACLTMATLEADRTVGPQMERIWLPSQWSHLWMALAIYWIGVLLYGLSQKRRLSRAGLLH